MLNLKRREYHTSDTLKHCYLWVLLAVLPIVGL